MTVAELIEKLNAMPQDANVMVLNPGRALEQVTIALSDPPGTVLFMPASEVFDLLKGWTVTVGSVA